MKLDKILNRDDLSDEVKSLIKEEWDKITKRMSLLCESERKYRTLVQTIPDIVYTIDNDGYFTFINDAIKKLGYEPNGLVGKHFSEILHPDDLEKVSSSHVLKKMKGKVTGEEESPKLFDERRTRERRTTNLEVRLISNREETKTGLIEVVTEVDASGLYDNPVETKGKRFLGTMGVIRDITLRLEAQEEIKKRQHKIDHLEKFLRVCASCRKILKPKSDDKKQENWIQMEVFIARKTDTTFSHGDCPICYQRVLEELKHFNAREKIR